MKAETDIKMTAAQYQALKAKYYATKRLKTGTQQSTVYKKNMMKKYTTLHQSTQYWQKKNT